MKIVITALWHDIENNTKLSTLYIKTRYKMYSSVLRCILQDGKQDVFYSINTTDDFYLNTRVLLKVLLLIYYSRTYLLMNLL